jgi:hypothetical protein
MKQMLSLVIIQYANSDGMIATLTGGYATIRRGKQRRELEI